MFNNSVACDLGEIISFDMNQCQLKVAFKTSSQQNDSHQLKNTLLISLFSFSQMDILRSNTGF